MHRFQSIPRKELPGAASQATLSRIQFRPACLAAEKTKETAEKAKNKVNVKEIGEKAKKAAERAKTTAQDIAEKAKNKVKETAMNNVLGDLEDKAS